MKLPRTNIYAAARMVMETSKTIVRPLSAAVASLRALLYLARPRGTWKLCRYMLHVCARACVCVCSCATTTPSGSPLYEYNYLLMVLAPLIRFHSVSLPRNYELCKLFLQRRKHSAPRVYRAVSRGAAYICVQRASWREF